MSVTLAMLVYEASLFEVFIPALDDCFQEVLKKKKPVFTGNCFVYCAGKENSCEILQLPVYSQI